MRYFDNIIGTTLLSNEHVMLLYEDKNKRNNFIIDVINEGLRNGCLCIFASVDLDDTKGISLIDSISSRIINYEDNIKNENLQFINFKPYYEAALKGDLTIFEKLKAELEDMLSKRVSEEKNDKILVFADAACHLSETKNLNECAYLEKWWQDIHIDWSRNNKNITVVCPHPNCVFKEELEQIIKDEICNSHNATIDIENEYSLQYFYNLIKKNSNSNGLINYEQTIKKTREEIECNFIEEHKNIINTFYSVYSKKLADIINDDLKNSKTMEGYSNNCMSESKQNLMENQTTITTTIVKEIIDNNIDTFLKSIEFAHKFYFDVVQSYYNYITRLKSIS